MQRLKTSTTPSYLMRTHAPPEAVMTFYRDAAHHPGLELVEDDSLLLIFRGNGREVDVGAQDEGYGRGTLIVYTWERRPTER